MRGRLWILIPLAAVATACADATAPAARMPEHAVPRATLGAGYDIVAQSIIPAGATCGHYATYDGMPVYGLDWEVDGVLVAQDVDGINYTNSGSAYTVSIGDWDGSAFTTYYSETFYPQQRNNMACLQLSPE
ncbi:hypothetical protein [Longimicrobium sp.]|uniref:hypothetical protein n=1 Tax=Longimicrobium sp. TaxID=2029185 RepID=UPI002C06F5B8|nr:hypothetical protein [Longimicrobium sp.]HSU16683.1 hypothetical protein [Longimicrobium sp.]